MPSTSLVGSSNPLTRFISRFKSLMSPERPKTHCLFPDKHSMTHLEIWSELVLSKETDLALSSYLVTLRRCKCNECPAHEFDIVDIDVGHKGKTYSVPMVFDRAPARNRVQTRNEPNTGSLPSLTSSNNQSLTSTSESSLNCFGHFAAIIPLTPDERYPAADRVFVPAADGKDSLKEMLGQIFRKGYYVLNTVNFTKGAITLAQLALLALAIHERAPFYTMTHYQCFWFSEMLFEVMSKSYKESQLQGVNFKKAGKFLFYTPGPKAVVDEPEVLELFQTKLAEFDSECLMLNGHCND
jgi:hypothetical protein